MGSRARQSFVAFLTSTLLTVQSWAGQCPSSGPNLCYLGGTVIHHPHVYLIRWHFDDDQPDTLDQFGVAKRYLTSVGGSKYINVVTQYTDSTGDSVHNDTNILKGYSYVDNYWPYNFNSPTAEPAPEAFELMLNDAAKALKVQTDPDAMFVVLTGRSRVGRGCGGYHAQVKNYAGGLDIPYTEIFYQADLSCEAFGASSDTPRPGTTKLPGWQSVTAAMHHEIAETVTDPRGDGWVFDRPNSDMADHCDPFLPVNLDGTLSYVIDLWDNSTSSCVFSYQTRSDEFFAGVQNSTYAMYHKSSDIGLDQWEPWGSPSGALINYGVRPGAVSLARNTFDIFTLDANNQLLHGHQTLPASPGWSRWGAPPASSGYTLTGTAVGAASWGSARLDAFALGVSGSTVHVFHRYYDSGSYSAWQDWGAPPGVSLSSRFGVAAVAVRPPDAARDVPSSGWPLLYFVVTDGSNVWLGWSTDGNTVAGWNNWGHSPGTVDSAPNIVAWHERLGSCTAWNATYAGQCDANTYYLGTHLEVLYTYGGVIQEKWSDSGSSGAGTVYGGWISGYGGSVGAPWLSGLGAVAMGTGKFRVGGKISVSPSGWGQRTVWGWGSSVFVFPPWNDQYGIDGSSSSPTGLPTHAGLSAFTSW